MKQFFVIILIWFFASIVIGCQGNSPATKMNETQTVIDLSDTGHFRDGALEHILEGEINSKGQAVGFHYEGLPSKKGEVIQETATTPDVNGIYEAKVKVKHIEKQSNNGYSTFFPKDWDAQAVVDAINEAYETRVFIAGNTYEGLTRDGIVIRMYLDEQNNIITAFPVY